MVQEFENLNLLAERVFGGGEKSTSKPPVQTYSELESAFNEIF